jgi:hypothetical protein
MPTRLAPVIGTHVGFQIQIVPADGIRLPMEGAETSERRRFWAALDQGNLLGRSSRYNVSALHDRTDEIPIFIAPQ